MSNRLSVEKLAKLRRYFGEHPDPSDWKAFRAAASACGTDARTAKKHYERTIKFEIAQQRVLARAELTREALRAEREAAPDLAGRDAAAQIAREATLARLASIEALALFSQIGKLRSTAQALVERVASEPATALSASAALERLEAISKLASRTIEVAHKSIQLERTRLGDPSIVIGVKPITEQPSLSEVEAELEAAARGLARVRAQRQLEDGDVGDAQ